MQEDYDTGMKLDPSIQAMLYKKHFSVEDNKENVSSSYMLTMKSLSKIDKRRFWTGSITMRWRGRYSTIYRGGQCRKKNRLYDI